MFNRATLVGYVSNDPEYKIAGDGHEYANFSLATSKKWRDREGNPQEMVQFHRICTRNEKLIAIIKQLIQKGSKVMVEGTIEYRKYTDREGIERYITEISLNDFRAVVLLLDSQRAKSEYTQPAPTTESQLIDDEIPF